MDIRKLIHERASRQGQSGGAVQLMFNSAPYETFAHFWGRGDGCDPWIMDLEAYVRLGAADLDYIIAILRVYQEQEYRVNHVLIASKGGGAFFYVAPDTAKMTEKTVVGLIPNACSPTKFAKAVAAAAPGAALTLLSDSAAGDTGLDGHIYKGIVMISELADALGQPVRASDQQVVRAGDGTAYTQGNIYQVTPRTRQIFPLTPMTRV